MKMTTKQLKLKQLLSQIDNFGKMPITPSFQVVDSDYLKSLNQKLETLNISPILQSIKDLQNEIVISENELKAEFETKISSIPKTPDLTEEVKNLQQNFEAKVTELQSENKDILKSLENKFQDFYEKDIQQDSEQKKEIKDEIDKLRIDLTTRINNRGGGNMNRQIFVGGNDPLTKYTDINFKAGSNITLTYANNNTTKKAEITITSSGGGGGAGIIRSINSISVDTAAGNSTTTDYVYLVSGTTTVTLPDATANTNLYTIKNVGTGVVTLATTSSQTIDGSLTAVMSVRYTSIDVESDGTNWNVT